MAIQAGLPIIPVVAENYWHIYRKGFFGTGVIKVRVLPPVPTEGLTTADISDLTERVRSQMLETLREISTHARKPTITEGKKPSSSPPVSEKEVKESHTFSGASIAINPSTPSTKSEGDSPQLDGTLSSSASLASFSTSSQLWKSTAGSETGGETEDDDMVLVGRPAKK